MAFKKIKLFSFKDSWIWAIITIGPTAAFLKALQYSHAHYTPIPVKAWIIFPIALGFFWIGTIYRYILRYKWLQTIGFYTKHGIIVFYKGNDPEKLKTDLETATEEVFQFFSKAEPAIEEQDYYEAIELLPLGFSSEPIKLGCGKTKSGELVPRIVAGYTTGDAIMAYWPIDNQDARATMLSVVKHELAHILLAVTGLTKGLGDFQHETMAKYKFPY